MIDIAKYRYFHFIPHILVWGIVLSFPYLVGDAGNDYKIGPLPGLYFTLSQIIHMIIFYLNVLFLYPKLFNRQFWWMYFLFSILLLIFSFRMKLFILDTFFAEDLQAVVPHITFPSIVVFIVSTFYSIAIERMRAEKLRKENEASRMEMELKLLRSQISPHFLFNIITNLISLARKKSDKLENSLLMLSGLMRYMLYDSDKKILLQQEVDYLQSYIALQRLRFGSDLDVLFNVNVSHEETYHKIEPMLLIPFVENAFKHGTGLIDINLTAKQAELIFAVKNEFDTSADMSKDESSGIGLNNVRSRLSLLYPGTHKLDIKNDNNLFNINLMIKLS